ncbi:unnamed protein product [Closterium sp. Naga37s-1]|nr:unnamed protein product [Closterium sp. Naga37s-1]
MRGSNDRVEVFKLSENLWFAGTAQLPPFEDVGNGGNSEGDNSGGDSNGGGDNSGGDNSGGDNSGSHGNSTGYDNSGGDSSAGIADGPRDSMETRKEELLARLRGGGMEAANAGGDQGSPASAPAAAPASAPAPAVDPLEQQMEERLAEVGEFSARTTELKQVVKRKPAVGFPEVRAFPPDVAPCVGNGNILHTVNVAMVVYDKQGKQLTHLHLPPYSHSIPFDCFLLPHPFPLPPHPMRPHGSNGCV